MTRQPVLFVGHGSPMNAIEDTTWSRAWRDLGQALPAPRAILAISAHWHVDGVLATAQGAPPTIHDFGGFPQALFDVEYPARGDAALVDRLRTVVDAAPDLAWGLDHGTWSVLRHLRPDADVPVVQLSLDRRRDPAAHLALGRSLAPLRDEGVLIYATGNVTHNLRHAFAAMRRGDATTPAWASRFDADVVRALEAHDAEALARLPSSDDGRLAHPTIEHYLPLLYAAGAAGDDAPSYPAQGWDASSLSMRAVRFG